MNEQNAPISEHPPLSAQAIGDYLIANPDFFQEHKQLLTRLSIPHPAGGATSLVERQVEVLRKENRKLERRLVEWMEIAQENDRLLARLHVLAVALLAEPRRAERVAVLTARLRDDFEAPAVALVLHKKIATALPGTRRLPRDDAAFAGLGETFAQGRPLCLSLSAERTARLFPEARELASAAFIPFNGTEAGVLVLASPDPKHFHPSLDTAYLSQLGDLASAALAGGAS